jgi:hypothetical protein
MDSAANHLLRQMIKQGESGLTKAPSKAIIRTLLLSDDAYATPLFLIVMDLYGQEALEWAPETIRMELEQDFQLQLPKSSLDKVMAAITIVTTNYFYKDVTRFIQLCNILAGDDFQPDEFDPADAGEILLGITEAMLLWPPDGDADDTEFSEEIRGYIGQVLNEQGIVKPFDVLRLALDGDQSTRVDTALADDPEMYSAVWSSQQSRTDELRSVYLENVQALAQQLSILPLTHGSTEKAVQQLQSLVSNATGAL